MSYVIFAVEDNPIAGEIVQTALGSRGHTVVVIPTGRGAIEWLSNNNCHLILLDLMLPDADGGQLVEVLRRLPNAAHVPILAFSAFAAKLADLRRSGAPFDGYIAKPVEPRDLIRIVEDHLHAVTA